VAEGLGEGVDGSLRRRVDVEARHRGQPLPGQAAHVDDERLPAGLEHRPHSLPGAQTQAQHVHVQDAAPLGQGSTWDGRQPRIIMVIKFASPQAYLY
jgi:hypothetical protein